MPDMLERYQKVKDRFKISSVIPTLDSLKAREELRLFIRNSHVVPPVELWATAFSVDPERALVIQKAFSLLENLGSLLRSGIGVINPSSTEFPNIEARMPGSDASAAEKILQLLFLSDIEWVALATIQLLVRDRYNQESYEALVSEFSQLGINVQLSGLNDDGSFSS